MKLRKLEKKDAPLMLEWMHDFSVVEHMGANFTEKTIDDCENFVAHSQNSERDLHLAIVDDEDVYMGTVSLKHINHELKMAEFAIAVRSVAMGEGFSAFGTKEIIRIGLEELELKKIVWCVSPLNERAVRFYDKNNFARITDVPEYYYKMYSKEQREFFLWYEVK